MLAYVIRRLFALVPTLLIVAIVVFSIMHLVPGDPVLYMLGEDASPELVNEIREELGLNDPLPQQFGRWLLGVVKGDLGHSIRSGEPVSTIVKQRIPISIELGVLSFILATIVALPTGIMAAVRRGSGLDVLMTSLGIAGISTPIFTLALLMIYVFALHLHWFPASGYVSPKTDFVAHIRYMTLPAIAHAGAATAIIMRMTRSSLLEVMNQDYVRTARAKGLSNQAVLFKHALQNAMIPVITIAGLQAGYLFGSAVITETVFGIPGLGRLMVNSLLARDYPLVQGTLLTIAVIFMVVNLIVDLAYKFIDPRIKYS